jgi:hypothetical protein
MSTLARPHFYLQCILSNVKINHQISITLHRYQTTIAQRGKLKYFLNFKYTLRFCWLQTKFITNGYCQNLKRLKLPVVKWQFVFNSNEHFAIPKINLSWSNNQIFHALVHLWLRRKQNLWIKLLCKAHLCKPQMGENGKMIKVDLKKFGGRTKWI